MALFQIDTEELLAKSQAVEGTIGRLQTEVNTMDGQLRQLNDSWRGQASANFQSIISEWRATQTRVEESLRSIRQAMNHAASQYQQTEQANAAMFR